MKTYKKLQNYSDILVKKFNKEIWPEWINAQDRNKLQNVQKPESEKSPRGRSQRSICHLWSRK